MAESVRELVVVLSLQTDKFKDTCTNINAQIKGVKAEFDALTGGTDAWQTTMEGRNAKLASLSEILSAQQTKIAEIAKALETAKTALEGDQTLAGAKKVSNLETQLNQAKTAAEKTKQEIEKINAISFLEAGAKLETFGRTLKRIGRKFSMVIGGPLAALGIKSFNLAKDYETAYVSMQKTVDETTTTTYDDISEAFLAYSEKAPVAYTELMELAGAAGALGVGADDVNKFVEEVSKIAATADDLDASTGMTAFAEFLNIADKGDFSNIDRVSSSVTDLGNKMSATEGQIMAMAQRMVSTATLAGMSKQEILALSASLVSYGIHAEAGGAAAGKLMKQMQTAAELGTKAETYSGYFDKQAQFYLDIAATLEEGSDAHTGAIIAAEQYLALSGDSAYQTYMNIEQMEGGWKAYAAMVNMTAEDAKNMVQSAVDLERFAEVLGVTKEEFVTGWDTDAGNTFLAFFKGLNEYEKSGKGTILGKLAELGISEIRMSNLAAAAAANPELYERALAIADEAYDLNEATTKEAEKRFNTAESFMDIQYNQMENAGADVGENVVDVFQPIIDKISDLVAKFGELDEDVQTRWVNIGSAVVLMGGAAIAIGSVAEGIGKIVTHIGKMKVTDASNITAAANGLTKLGGISSAGFFTLALGVGALALALTSAFAPGMDDIINSLKNIQITVDQKKVDEALAEIARVQAAADKLSGQEFYAQFGGQSAAVKAGYGTTSMFAQAIGYEQEMAERAIADASAKYAPMIADYNDNIVTAYKLGDRERADGYAATRDAMQLEWDASVTASKVAYTQAMSDLMSGMLAKNTEASATLKKAIGDYNLFNAVSDAMAKDTSAGWQELFTPEVLAAYFPEIKDFESVGSDQYMTMGLKLSGILTKSMRDGLATVSAGEGEASPVFTLLQTMISDPGNLDLLDFTGIQGAFEGAVKLIDFQAAAGEGANLTQGLADKITETTDAPVAAITGMTEAMIDRLKTKLESHSPSEVTKREGTNITDGIAAGILAGIPQVTAAMNALGAAITAVAAARGAEAGRAYGQHFTRNVKSQFYAAIAQIQQELINLNARILAGYGKIR